MGDQPQRFYDSRQVYLTFVTNCNEKWKIAERSAQELADITPRLPAFHLFDAGMGDGTVLSNVMRAIHRRFPTVPLFAVGKEISLEDVRLGLEKLPDRFVEHPATVVVITNLNYSEAPWLRPSNPENADNLMWLEVELDGHSAYEYGEQLRELDPQLVEGWHVTASPKSGNPLYVRPSVIVLYRRDHRFLLESVLEHCRNHIGAYDLVLASQPWRARVSTSFKVSRVLAPLARCLRSGGRILVVQGYGRDPGLELIQEIWPGENPFQADRHALLDALSDELGSSVNHLQFDRIPDSESIFRYQMHTLPSEIGSSIGTSTLLAAWNAAIYVAQIDDERLQKAVSSRDYLDATARIIRKHDGLWFNDESFVVTCRDPI